MVLWIMHYEYDLVSYLRPPIHKWPWRCHDANQHMSLRSAVCTVRCPKSTHVITISCVHSSLSGETADLTAMRIKMRIESGAGHTAMRTIVRKIRYNGKVPDIAALQCIRYVPPSVGLHQMHANNVLLCHLGVSPLNHFSKFHNSSYVGIHSHWGNVLILQFLRDQPVRKV
jgi:hypothetical protein